MSCRVRRSVLPQSSFSQADLSFHQYTAIKRGHLYHATLGSPRFSWQSDARLTIVNIWNPPTTSQTYVSMGPTLHRNNGMTTCLYVYPRACLVYWLGYGEFCTPSPQALTSTPRTSPATINVPDPPQLPGVLVAYPPTKMSLF